MRILRERERERERGREADREGETEGESEGRGKGGRERVREGEKGEIERRRERAHFILCLSHVIVLMRTKLN